LTTPALQTIFARKNRANNKAAPDGVARARRTRYLVIVVTLFRNSPWRYQSSA
jgi:hypothetical protein